MPSAHAVGRAQLVAWGAAFYAIPPIVPSLLDELAISASTLGLAVGGGLVIAAFAAIPLGARIQRRGGRDVMTAGSIVAACALVVLACSSSSTGALVALVVLGGSHAALLYEPAFAALDATTSDPVQRVRAIHIITFWGGWAALVAIPLVTVMTAWIGWRGALVVMAALLLVFTLPVHLRLPAPLRARATIACDTRLPRWLVTGFALGAFALAALSVHGIAMLVDLGVDAQTAALVFAVMAPAQVATRLYFLRRTGLTDRDRILPFVLSAGGIAAMIAAPHPLALVLVSVLFGAGAGLMTTVRSAVLATTVPPHQFAIQLGAMNFVLGLARAGAPFAFAFTASQTGAVTALAGATLVAIAGGTIVWSVRRASSCTPACGDVSCAW